jgi:cytochrome c oxidase subunit 3
MGIILLEVSNYNNIFLYIVLLCIIHLAGGLISLVIIIYNHFKQNTTQSNSWYELGAMYWHFLDLLIYLFVFFIFL